MRISCVKILLYYYIKYGEPEKTTGPSGVIPIAVLKEDYNNRNTTMYLGFYYWKLNLEWL